MLDLWNAVSNQPSHFIAPSNYSINHMRRLLAEWCKERDGENTSHLNCFIWHFYCLFISFSCRCRSFLCERYILIILLTIIFQKKWKNLDEKIIFICYLKCSPFSSFLTIHQLILRIDCICILIATNEVGHPTKGIPRCSKLTTIHDTRMARIENGTSIKCCRSKDMIKINILN